MIETSHNSQTKRGLEESQELRRDFPPAARKMERRRQSWLTEGFCELRMVPKAFQNRNGPLFFFGAGYCPRFFFVI